MGLILPAVNSENSPIVFRKQREDLFVIFYNVIIF